MKSIFSLRALVLLAGVLASGLVSAATDQAFHGALIGLPVTGTSGTMTYALASKTNTVVSSVIDMRTFGGMYVQVTGTAGATGVEVQFNNVSNNAAVLWATAAVVPVGGVQPVRKTGSWARFRALAQNTVPYKVSATVTAFYEPVVEGGSSSAQGAPGTQNWPVVITSTVTALGVSSTSRVVSGPTVINLTAVAGINGPTEVIFGGTTNSPTGVYYRFTGSSAWPLNGLWHLFSISTTPVALTNRAPGSHLLLSPTSATDISFTAVVDIQSLAVR